MIDEATRKKIEAYIPSPRDPELKFNEYYINDSGGRVQKGRVTDIIGLAGDEKPRYILRNNRGRIKGPWKYDSFLKAEMYDNAEDCKARTHGACDYWEQLRKIQESEMKGEKLCR